MPFLNAVVFMVLKVPGKCVSASEQICDGVRE